MAISLLKIIITDSELSVKSDFQTAEDTMLLLKLLVINHVQKEWHQEFL